MTTALTESLKAKPDDEIQKQNGPRQGKITKFEPCLIQHRN